MEGKYDLEHTSLRLEGENSLIDDNNEHYNLKLSLLLPRSLNVTIQGFRSMMVTIRIMDAMLYLLVHVLRAILHCQHVCFHMCLEIWTMR